MLMDSTDPFHTFKNKINDQVEKIQAENETYLDFVKNNDTSQGGESRRLYKGLVEDLRKAEKDLKMLHGGVDNVVKNRHNYPHINDVDLRHRQRIVGNMQKCLKDVKTAIESPLIRRKLEDDQNGAPNRDVNKTGAPDYSNGAAAQITASNGVFIKNNQQEIKRTIKRQDELLNELVTVVNRLSLTSGAIHTEVVEQKVLLDDLENDMDKAGNKMGVLLKAVDKLLKRII